MLVNSIKLFNKFIPLTSNIILKEMSIVLLLIHILHDFLQQLFGADF